MAELTAQSDPVVFENSVRIEIAGARMPSSLTVRLIPMTNAPVSLEIAGKVVGLGSYPSRALRDETAFRRRWVIRPPRAWCSGMASPGFGEALRTRTVLQGGPCAFCGDL